MRFGEALSLAREIRCPLEEARALEGIGRCELASGERGRADEVLREAVAVYERLGVAETVRELERLLAAQAG